MIDIAAIRARYETLAPLLNERARRLFAASEAQAAGRGGIAAVSRASGIARSTIGRGLAELRDGTAPTAGRVRRTGGGSKLATETQPLLLASLEGLVQSSIRGDPEAPLRWVSKSQRHLSSALAGQGFTAGQKLVGRLLAKLGFSLQANRKTREGAQHPDRNAQFEHINAAVQAFQAAGEPVISVDTKKKELVGDFKNGGRELCPKGHPEPVRVHDFAIPELGKAVPYGVYDIAANTGWVNVGINHDTAAFAVESIRRWWHELGAARYPNASRLLITADCGGSNGVASAAVEARAPDARRPDSASPSLSTTCRPAPAVESATGAVALGVGELPLAGGFRHMPVPHSQPYAPFPVTARQTGRADFPHPAFSRPIRPSLSTDRRTALGRR